MKKKSIAINTVIVILITGLAVYYLSKTEVITKDSLSLIPWYAVLLALLFFFSSLLLLSLVDFTVYRTFTADMTYLKCVKNTLSGHLGSSVTPYRAGHFPLMAFYQTNDGIKLSDTATGLVKCQIIYSTTAIVIYSVIVAILAIRGNTIEFNGQFVALWAVIALGLGFHAGAFAITVLLAFNPPLQKAVLKFSASVLGKLKKSFDKEKFISEKTEKLKTFKQQIAVIGKKFYYYALPCALYALYMFFSGAIQYVSFLLISKTDFSIDEYLTFYVLSLASAYITNIVPIPGGAGTSEVVFSMIFVAVIPQAVLGSVLVLWRASVFYFAVIAEIIWFIVFITAKQIKRNVNKNEFAKTDIK